MNERLWNILAAVLALLAVGFLWWNNLTVAFVLGTLGAVAWFLAYRSHLRTGIQEREVEQSINDDDED